VSVPITDRIGRETDTKGRHQVVKEAVEVIRSELDDQVRREISRALSNLTEAVFYCGLRAIICNSIVKQWRVGSTYCL